MVTVRNAKCIFKEVPKGMLFVDISRDRATQHRMLGFPEPNKHTVTDTSETIDLDNVPLDGGFLVKTLVLSIDPYLRGKMRAPEIKSYSVSSLSLRSRMLLNPLACVHSWRTVSMFHIP
jgi:NADPH-dependent curcumin reductase CurA